MLYGSGAPPSMLLTSLIKALRSATPFDMTAGEQMREISYRFGINVVMHVLTGNYKSDQVHVPALLERLGQ